jgi:4-diphosphocytidyl-2-C-methyl-D-erythritol kinase
LIEVLRGTRPEALAASLYNSLEAPVLRKYPLLEVIQRFLRGHGAWGALMSGSGSTTFAITSDSDAAVSLSRRLADYLGRTAWMATAVL